MVFPGLKKAGLRSLYEGLVSIWISRSGSRTLIASEFPPELISAIPALSPFSSPPKRSYLKGVVFEDGSAEFQLCSPDGEMLGHSLELSAAVVEGQILSRLVYDTGKLTF